MATATYPGTFTVWVSKVDNDDTVYADHINKLQAELQATQRTIGLSPQISENGTTFSTLSARLFDLETNAVHLAGSETITGPKTFTGEIALLQMLFTSTVANALSTPGALQLGPSAAQNVVGDSSGFQSRNNGSASALSMQPLGGDTNFGGNINLTGGSNTLTGKVNALDFRQSAGTFTVTGSLPTFNTSLGVNVVDNTGGPHPKKSIRVSGGHLQFVNDAYDAVLFDLSDAGVLTTPQAHILPQGWSKSFPSLNRPIVVGGGYATDIVIFNLKNSANLMVVATFGLNVTTKDNYVHAECSVFFDSVDIVQAVTTTTMMPSQPVFGQTSPHTVIGVTGTLGVGNHTFQLRVQNTNPSATTVVLQDAAIWFYAAGVTFL